VLERELTNEDSCNGDDWLQIKCYGHRIQNNIFLVIAQHMFKLKWSWYYLVPKKRKNRRDMTHILLFFVFLLGIVVDRIGAPYCRYASACGMDI
jgi:hypothetical protein